MKSNAERGTGEPVRPREILEPLEAFLWNPKPRMWRRSHKRDETTMSTANWYTICICIHDMSNRHSLFVY